MGSLSTPPGVRARNIAWRSSRAGSPSGGGSPWAGSISAARVARPLGSGKKASIPLAAKKKACLIPRQLPVNLDIRRHEIGGIIVTRERDTECVANRTVGAVAGDEIGGVGRFLSAVGKLKRCAHPVFVLLERNEFDTPFHLCAETRQIAGHYTLCLPLGQLQNEGKG